VFSGEIRILVYQIRMLPGATCAIRSSFQIESNLVILTLSAPTLKMSIGTTLRQNILTQYISTQLGFLETFHIEITLIANSVPDQTLPLTGGV